jgi:hypothetical protein
MELTREEGEQVKAHIGELLTGEPITDAELENLARVSPAAFYVIARLELGITGGASADDVLRALPDDLLEELQSKFRDFFERSNPRQPDTWDPEILYLTERLVLDGESAGNATNKEMSRAAFELINYRQLEAGGLRFQLSGQSLVLRPERTASGAG